MRTLLCSLFLLGALNDAPAQGVVTFSNDSFVLFSPPDRLVRFDPVTIGTGAPNPFGTNNAPVVGTNFLAQLYYGAATATEGSLVPVSSPPVTFRPATSLSPGSWFGANRTINGVTTGDTVNFQVRVWDITYASSWEEYLVARQGAAGESAIFSYTFCSAACPPGSEYLNNFQGFYIGIPEPSGSSLAILGLLILCSFEKMKQQRNLRRNHETHSGCTR